MATVRFVPYTPAHRQAWYDLNEEWISQYFTMEASDYHVLEDPEGTIIDQGGHILIMEVDGIPAGTGGLLKMTSGKYDYELVKMCIAPSQRGRGLGYQLGLALLDLGRSVGARSLYLESNDRLAPALEVYRKLGFKDVAGAPSPYARCNVQMGVQL